MNLSQPPRTNWFVLLLVIIGFLVVFFNYYWAFQLSMNIRNMAGVFFIDSTTPEKIRADYVKAKAGIKQQDKIKILLVPGHDNDYWGTEFRRTKEADLNLNVAKELAKKLSEEKEFEVILARDDNGYTKIFLDYFEKEKAGILAFQKSQKMIMDSLVDDGQIQTNTKNQVIHNKAPNDTAFKLYGINKWANENGVDLVLHIHFNDDPIRKYGKKGEYSGFSIYVPESQYSNAKASMAVARNVFNQLEKFFPVSDLPKEKDGIIEDQTLIAIGSNNTLDPAVMLIEYGYIYEPQFTNTEVRTLAIKELSLQTYNGIKNFFEETEVLTPGVGYTAVLPHRWTDNLQNGKKNNEDVYALQMALTLENLYPPANLTKNDCPINGNFGPCTETAVKAFQELYEIEPVMGIVGPATREKLNELYSE